MKYTLSVLKRGQDAKSAIREIGSYDSLDDAVAAARQTVDETLRRLYTSGMTPDQLFDCYRDAAETPYIMRDDEQTMNARSFNHFQFAKTRSEEICAAKP